MDKKEQPQIPYTRSHGRSNQLKQTEYLSILGDYGPYQCQHDYQHQCEAETYP